MHRSDSAPVDLPAVLRLLRLRFSRREALLEALLEAVTGQRDLSAVGQDDARRLAAMLRAHSDSELEVIARRGHPGRTRIQFEFEVLFDGSVTDAEREAMTRRLLTLLKSERWAADTLRVRALVLGEVRVREGPGE